MDETLETVARPGSWQDATPRDLRDANRPPHKPVVEARNQSTWQSRATTGQVEPTRVVHAAQGACRVQGFGNTSCFIGHYWKTEPGSTGWVVYGFWRPFLIFVPVLGVMVRPVFPGLPHQILLVPFEGGAEIQTAAGAAGRRVWSARRVHSARQGHRVGRCRVRRRAERAIRAGTMISRVRRVAVVATARAWPGRVAARAPAARSRLNAIVARASQAALAVNTPDGRRASGPFLRSALTFSTKACAR